MASERRIRGLSPDDQLICGRQAREYLGGISRNKERQLREHDGLPFIRFGERSIRYRVGDLRRWLDSRRVNAAV